MLARGVLSQNRRPSGLGLGFFLAAFAPRLLLPPITTFDDGCETSATRRVEWRYLVVEPINRIPGPREGCRKHHPTGQDRFWRRQHPSRYDQSKFFLSLYLSTAG